MVIWNASCAGLCVKAVGKWIAQCEDASARPGSCFKYRDVVTCPCKFVRRRQAGQPSANDNHSLRSASSLQIGLGERQYR